MLSDDDDGEKGCDDVVDGVERGSLFEEVGVGDNVKCSRFDLLHILAAPHNFVTHNRECLVTHHSHDLSRRKADDCHQKFKPQNMYTAC